MKKRISIKTLYLIGIITVGLIGLGIGSTYAMFTSTIETVNIVGTAVNLNADSEIMETIDITVNAKSKMEIPVTIKSARSVRKYSVWYITDNDDIEIGTNLSNSDSSSPSGRLGRGATKKVYIQVKNYSSSKVTITFGVSSSSLTGSIVISNNMSIVPNEELSSDNLLEYIKYLYDESIDTTSVSDGNDSYDYDVTNNLMKDTLENIRYYGISPNNYIYFNCTDYNNQSSSTCETWRIIGIVDGKVKLIRYDSIGQMPWNTSYNSNTGVMNQNDWSTATLNEYLNTTYLDTLSTTTQNLISDSAVWYLRDSGMSYSKDTLNYERELGQINYGNLTSWSSTNNSSAWTTKIGLPYVSDYGYAAEFGDGKCQQKLIDYGNSNCTSNNWMFPIFKTSASAYATWFITPMYNSSSKKYIYHVTYVGYVETQFANNINYGQMTRNYRVVPVLYLDENIERNFAAGDGTKENPYQLVVE